MFNKKNMGMLWMMIFFVAAMMIFFGCSKQEDIVDKKTEVIQKQKEQFITKTSRDILLIIAPTDFNDEEFLKVKVALFNAGHTVVVASTTKEPAVGMQGSLITPDVLITEVNPADFFYVVVIGGSGAPALATNQDVLKVVKEAKNVAAICLGPMTLASAGRLEGKRATVFKTMSSLKTLNDGKATFTNNEVEVDGTLITANSPDASDKFAEILVALIG